MVHCSHMSFVNRSSAIVFHNYVSLIFMIKMSNYQLCFCFLLPPLRKIGMIGVCVCLSHISYMEDSSIMVEGNDLKLGR